MEFSINWLRKAEKRFDSIQINLQDRFLKKLEKMQEDPFRFLEHFEGRDSYKFRVGEYRFLIKIDIENKILTIEDFDKRARVYAREETEEYNSNKKNNSLPESVIRNQKSNQSFLLKKGINFPSALAK